MEEGGGRSDPRGREEEEGVLEWGGGEDLTCESVSDWGRGGVSLAQGQDCSGCVCSQCSWV